MVKRIVMFLVLVFIVSCRTEKVTEPVVSTPYELWLSKNIHDYSIDQTRSCFCINAGVAVRITIKADTVFSVVKISDNSLITTGYYFTVDSLFGIINDSENDSLVIKYNDEYGYPEFLDINPQLHPIDGGVLYVNSNLIVE